MAAVSFGKKYLNIGSRQAFGVDFNNESIKILQLFKSRKYSELAGWAKKNLPKNVMDYYDIQDEKKFQETFLSAVKESEGKIKGRDIVISLPENKVFTRTITIPLMEQQEAAETVKWETESNIPIAIDEVYYDWQIVEKEKENMKVLVMACPKKLIDHYLRVFEEIGYNVVAMEAESIATGRSVLGVDDKSASLIVDIGSENTSFAIYQNGFPVFTSSGSVSGKIITDMLSKTLKIDEEKAESYKIKIGLGDEKSTKGEGYEALKPVVSSMVVELQRTINFFEEKLNTSKDSISRIIMCGGGANLKGLAAYLAVNLQIDVVLSNPWTNLFLGANTPPISKEQSQGYANVIGLALRAQSYEDYT